MEYNKLRLNDLCFGAEKGFIPLGIKVNYAFENGKITQKQDGWKVECLSMGIYEKLTVKVVNDPKISQEMIDNWDPDMRIEFIDFEGRLYKDFKSNNVGISCKAQSVNIIK